MSKAEAENILNKYVTTAIDSMGYRNHYLVRHELQAAIETALNERDAKLEIAVKALEFYGSRYSWNESDCETCIQEDDTELTDYVKQLGAKSFGGKRAREALKQITHDKE